MYPKRLEVKDKKWQDFFDAMYVHERERLNLPPDIFLKCPHLGCILG